MCTNHIGDCVVRVQLCHDNLGGLVRDDQGLRTEGAARCCTVVVINNNAQVVFREDLLDQIVGAVLMEVVRLSIKCKVVALSPHAADTFARRIETLLYLEQAGENSFPNFNYKM